MLKISHDQTKVLNSQTVAVKRHVYCNMYNLKFLIYDSLFSIFRAKCKKSLRTYWQKLYSADSKNNISSYVIVLQFHSKNIARIFVPFCMQIFML